VAYRRKAEFQLEVHREINIYIAHKKMT